MASPLDNTPTDTTTNIDSTFSSSSTSSSSQLTRPTSGPLYNPLFGLTCLGIATHDGAGWFTTTLCALAGANPAKVNASVHLDKGTYNNAESATFSVYDIDGNAKKFPVSFLGGGGPGIVNSGDKAWFPGGFRSAVVSAGVKTGEIGDDGKGVVNNQLFNDTGSSDDKLVAAGEWGFKYLTGVDAEKEDVAKDGKNWGMSSSEENDWMDKAYKNPVIILTNDKSTAKGLEPNQYYTVYLTKNEDKTISVWHTTTDQNDLLNLFIKVDPKELKENTRYLYHLKGWAAY
nr:hypothetical protein L204_03592 [Cryptococcus depauperatus CBS 7855]